jgi:thiamine pyrophosphokinase
LRKADGSHAGGRRDEDFMENTLKLPVGIDSFDKIRKNGFYYIDKSGLIEQLVQLGGEVTLFTRPRRFGKTLNMSMLRSFFETGTDASLFDGLYISGNKEICDEYMGKYPVIFLSLKDVDGLKYENAKYRIMELIGREAERYFFLGDSDRLSENEKEQYKTMIALQNGKYSMDENVLTSSLRLLSHLLFQHYGEKTVILIDEYDVPLDKAFQNGYYQEMVSLIRGLFGMALKTNDSLQFAVLTGCLRISKESIFTGLNNFKVLSILDSRFDEQFGFTDQEVQKILDDYELSSHFKETKEWYDGYRFGKADIYCPWDVINYVEQLRYDPEAVPQDFWSNSSGNAIVRRFIDMADVSTKNEIERLIAGESIEKNVTPELTYDELDKSIENLWSVLFTTGYLTHKGRTESGKYRLVIPNREVRNLFVKKIREWFSDVSRKDGQTLEQLCDAFVNKNVEKIEQIFGDYLWNTISIRDTAVAKEKKENFYHGILLGLLGYKSTWLIKSNAESGIGYSDILVEVPTNRTGIVIELKYAEGGDMDAACEEAMRQIEEKGYIAKLKQDGMRNFIRYGIACYKKDCRVVVD